MKAAEGDRSRNGRNVRPPAVSRSQAAPRATRSPEERAERPAAGGVQACKAADAEDLPAAFGRNVRPPAVSNFVRGRPPGAVAAGSPLAFGPAVREP